MTEKTNVEKKKPLDFGLPFPLAFPGNEYTDGCGHGTGGSREVSVHRTGTKDAWGPSCSDQGPNKAEVWGPPSAHHNLWQGFKRFDLKPWPEREEGAAPTLTLS